VDGVQHAVDPEPHLARVTLWLDVNVARPLVKGVAEQEFHGIHHVLVRGLDLGYGLHLDKLFEIAQVDLGPHLFCRGCNGRAEAIKFRYDLEDVRLRSNNALDLIAHSFDVFDNFNIIRIGYRDQESIVFAFDRNGNASARKGPGKDLRYDLRIKLQRIDFLEWQTGVLRHELRDHILRQDLTRRAGYLQIQRCSHFDGRHLVLDVHPAPRDGVTAGLEHPHPLNILFDLDLSGLFRRQFFCLDQYLGEKICG